MGRREVITNREFVRAISDCTGYAQSAIKEVVDAMELVLHDCLLQATDDTDIAVKVSPHIAVTNKIYQGSRHVLPDGKEVKTPMRYRTKARITGDLQNLDPYNDELYGVFNRR